MFSYNCFIVHLVFGYEFTLTENSATKFVLVASVPHNSIQQIFIESFYTRHYAKSGDKMGMETVSFVMTLIV